MSRGKKEGKKIGRVNKKEERNFMEEKESEIKVGRGKKTRRKQWEGM